jgi:hypothetical protein
LQEVCCLHIIHTQPVCKGMLMGFRVKNQVRSVLNTSRCSELGNEKAAVK